MKLEYCYVNKMNVGLVKKVIKLTCKNCSMKLKFQDIIVSDGKSLSQPACPREWKKCKEVNE